MSNGTTDTQQATTDTSTPESQFLKPEDKPRTGPEIIFVEGKKITIYPDGARVTECSDGTVVTEAEGKKVTEKPDGTKITEQNGFKTTEHPDGTVEKERPFLLDMMMGVGALSLGIGAAGMFSGPQQALSGEEPTSFLQSAMEALGTEIRGAARDRGGPQVVAPKLADFAP